MKSLLGILALVILLGGPLGFRNAVANTEVGISDSLPLILMPSGVFTMFNAATMATDSENAFLGVFGVLIGGVTLGLGLLYGEPVVAGGGAIAATVGFIAYRQASGRDASTSKVSFEPTISRDGYGASLSIRF